MKNETVINLFNALKGDADQITYFQLWNALRKQGIRSSDIRLEDLEKDIFKLKQNGINFLTLEAFDKLLSGTDAFNLIERTLRGDLVVKNGQTFKNIVSNIFDEVENVREGNVADYIPELRDISNKDGFAVSICSVDGQVWSWGDKDHMFGLQSTCKSVNYLIALEELGETDVHFHVGREPSGLAFNAPNFKSQLMGPKEQEYFRSLIEGEQKLIPHNPLINSGAIMCCALIASLAGEKERSKSIKMVRSFWERLVKGGGSNSVSPDPAVAESENDTAWTNVALSNMMVANGIWPKGKEGNIPKIGNVLEFYFKCCAMELNADMMAIAAATLANSGIHPFTHDKIFEPSHVKNCLSMMYSCGMYDYSGEFAFRIGLPAKSGVSGALMVVVPGKMGICIWSPKLDHNGNSVRGIEFCKRLQEKLNLHVYDGLVESKSHDVFNNNSTSLTQKTMIINAASVGDIDMINRLVADGVNVSSDLSDYDNRTPLHLAAAEGQVAVVNYLLSNGANVNPIDRWRSTPLDDAYSNNELEVIALLKSKGGKRNNLYRESVAMVMAAKEGNLTLLKEYHKSGGNLNDVGYDQRTPLHLAAKEGHYSVVKFLLEKAKVSPSPKDIWNRTPLDEAKSAKVNGKLIDLFKSHLNK